MGKKNIRQPDQYLNKRESQIMDTVYRLGKATVQEICDEIPEIPNYTAARVLMHLLEDKGLLRHERNGQKYVYYAAAPIDKARREELGHVQHTYFGGSTRDVMADLLEMNQSNMSEEEWDELLTMIDEARKKGR